MRRIIERVVTVVTTTTWKISWEQEPLLHPQATVDPVSAETSSSKTLAEITTPGPTLIEPKEVEPPEKENSPD